MGPDVCLVILCALTVLSEYCYRKGGVVFHLTSDRAEVQSTSTARKKILFPIKNVVIFDSNRLIFP